MADTNPIWQIYEEGTSKPVNWADHQPNRRFAVWDHGTPGDATDDLVLDKETKLIWTRNVTMPCSSDDACNWHEAVQYVRDTMIGGRRGWRLPSVEELLSLIDMSQGSKPKLPAGNPFVNVTDTLYWTMTIAEDDSSSVWIVNINYGNVTNTGTKQHRYCVWPVRGGK